VEFEITETAVLEDRQSALEILQQLKSLGVSLALDDFGTGFSSLTHLKMLPIDVLKMDRSFLADVLDDVKAKNLYVGVVQLAHSIGMEVVAEGVETREQVEFLKESGCDVLQGYYFSRPLPPEEIRQVVLGEIPLPPL
jgi:EAL domain-containing protein (putative c-di-GMP-specific phosphodiesterase class I)